MSAKAPTSPPKGPKPSPPPAPPTNTNEPIYSAEERAQEIGSCITDKFDREDAETTAVREIHAAEQAAREKGVVRMSGDTFVACFEHNIPYPAGGRCPLCEKGAEKKKVTPLDIIEEEFERLESEEGHGALRDHDYLMATRHFEELRRRLTARFE